MSESNNTTRKTFCVALAATLIPAALYGLYRLGIRRRELVVKKDSASFDSQVTNEIDDSAEREEKLMKRREAILAQPIVVAPFREVVTSPPSSAESTTSGIDSLNWSTDEEDTLVPQVTTRNLKFYSYYDVEIRGSQGNTSESDADSDVKDYEKSDYKGYSSYNASEDSDSKYFKQPPIDVKRLSDWNRRYYAAFPPINISVILTLNISHKGSKTASQS